MKKRTKKLFPVLWAAGGIAAASPVGDADVIGVNASPHGKGVYDFLVTVRSRDTGWERYADRIEAVAPDGHVLGTRILEHPHDDEQPFTRDLFGVHIPDAVHKVTIRAHFRPTGWTGGTFVVTLPKEPN